MVLTVATILRDKRNEYRVQNSLERGFMWLDPIYFYCWPCGVLTEKATF